MIVASLRPQSHRTAPDTNKVAAFHGNADSLEVLLANGCVIGEKDLFAACSRGHEKVVEALLKAGVATEGSGAIFRWV